MISNTINKVIFLELINNKAFNYRINKKKIINKKNRVIYNMIN